MARVLVDGRWFDEVASHAMYESDFERLVNRHSSSLFPKYSVVPFKRLVCDDNAAAKADFAMVHVEYRDWWVVEVEMAHHSLNGHVVPQVKTLSRARYGEEEVQHLHSQCSTLDLERLRAMVKGAQPRVLVVVNSPRPDWKLQLAPHGALVAVLEIFRSQQNEYIYRVNGDTPANLVEAQSLCQLDRQIPRLLAIESPGILTFKNGERIRIRFGNGQSEWVRIDTADRVWLSPTGNNPLELRKRYWLCRDENGEFSISEESGQPNS